MELVFKITLVGLVAAAFLLALQRRYLFVVRVKDGRARIASGKLTSAFLEEIDQVCRDAGVTRGWIGGIRRGRRVVLAFSYNIPSPCQQRLRNLWMLHR